MKPINKCRACDCETLTEFLDLGNQYLSDFRDDDKRPPRYPLVAVICEDCKLVQLKHTTPQPEMYHDRYGFKSGISQTIKDDLNDVVTHAYQYKNDPKNWLDIASNDGTLLSFVPEDVYRVGVDPVKFLCDEAEQKANRIVNAYFDSDLFTIYGNDGHSDFERFDVVTSVSCFYDMPNPSKFVQDVMNVLKWDGVWIIQQNYLYTTMQLSAVDNFCHEHLEYYTLLSLENLLGRFGLEVNEVRLSTVNGGSIRTVVSRKGSFDIDLSVAEQRNIERLARLGTIAPYLVFADSVTDQLDMLHKLVSDLQDQGKSVCVLAASTRGATIWQAAHLEGLLDYAVERNPAKAGRRFSAMDIPILSEEDFRVNQPDYAIVGPWFFQEEIMEREQAYHDAGGRFIIPLPNVEVL